MFWREAREFQLPVCMFLSIFLPPPPAVTKWPNFHIKYNGSLFKRKSFMLDELTLQNASKFTIFLGISKLLFFKVVYFSLMNALDGLWLLAMQFISENIKYVKKSISLEHFFKHKPPNSEEWFILPNFLLFGKQILIRKKNNQKYFTMYLPAKRSEE